MEEDLKPCWRDLGVTEEGERVCDALIDDLVALLKKCPSELEASLLTEARFRARELPKKTLDYRKRYEEENEMTR